MPISACFRFDATGFTFDRTDQTWDQTICPTGVITIPDVPTGGGQDIWERYRLEYEFKPNWYHFPESKKRIKRNIIRVAKEKKRIEAQVHAQPSAMDFQQLMARLNYAQDLLNELMQHYQESVKREQATRDDTDEEAEFMELLTVIL